MDRFILFCILGGLLGMISGWAICGVPVLLVCGFFAGMTLVCNRLAALVDKSLTTLADRGLGMFLTRRGARRGEFLQTMRKVEDETHRTANELRIELNQVQQAYEGETAGLKQDVMTVDLHTLPESLRQPAAEYRRMEGLDRTCLVEKEWVSGGEAFGCLQPSIEVTIVHLSDYERASQERDRVWNSILNILRDASVLQPADDTHT